MRKGSSRLKQSRTQGPTAQWEPEKLLVQPSGEGRLNMHKKSKRSLMTESMLLNNLLLKKKRINKHIYKIINTFFFFIRKAKFTNSGEIYHTNKIRSSKRPDGTGFLKNWIWPFGCGIGRSIEFWNLLKATIMTVIK